MKKLYLLLVTLFTAIAANAITLSGDVYKWDTATGAGVLGEEKVQAEVTINNDTGGISIANFLGSSLNIELTVTTESVTESLTTGTYEGTYNLGSFGTYSDMYACAGSYNYDDFEYYLDEGVKTLHFGAYFGDDWFDIYFALPDDFEPFNPYSAYPQKTMFVDILDGNGNIVSAEKITAYIDGNDYIFIGLFGMSKTTYTIGDDGSISSSIKRASWITCDYTYNGVSNTYAYSYGQQYLSYDATKKAITDYIWLWESDAGFYFTISETNSYKYSVYNINNEIETEGYLKGSSLDENGNISFSGLFGTSSVTYNITDGKVTTDFAKWVAANGYKYNDVANDYVSIYGGEDASYNDITETITDYVYFYNSKVGRWFRINIGDGTLKLNASIAQYDNDARNYVYATNKIKVPATYENGVITLPNFLGSGIEFVVTTNKYGVATHNQSKGKLQGSFTFGEFGTFDYITLSGGENDFEYFTSDGKKYLSFNPYAGKDDTIEYLLIELPDEFVAPDPYEGLESTELTMNVYDRDSKTVVNEDKVTAYIIDSNKIAILGLFNRTAPLELTLNEETYKVTSSWSSEYYYPEEAYDYKGTAFDEFYFDSGKLSYSSVTQTLTGRVYFDGYRNFSIVIPTWLKEPEGTKYTVQATINDYYKKYFETEVVDMKIFVNGNTVTIPNYLGGGQTITYEFSEDGATVSGGVPSGYTALDFTGGKTNFNSTYGYGTYAWFDRSANQIYDGYYVYTTEGNYTAYTWFDVYINLPSALEKNAEVRSIENDVESKSAIYTHIGTSVSGSTFTVSNPFGTTGFSLPFIMQTDGGVYSTYALGGYYTKNYSLNGKSYKRLHDLAREYNVETRVFKWTVGLEEVAGSGDMDKYNIYFTLPEDYTPSKPIVIESVKANVYVTSVRGVEKQAYASTATVNLTDKEENKVTLTKAFGQNVSINLSWDENGAVTVDGKFSRQYYEIGDDYYTSITVDAEKSKYVKEYKEEYIELAITTGDGYNGYDAYTDAIYRIFLVKKTADVQTFTLRAYEYDLENDDYGEKHSTFISEYSIDDSRLTFNEILDSDLGLTIHFVETESAEGEEETGGTVETSLKAGEYEGTFYALGNTYSKLTYAGDSTAAGWEDYRGYKYFWMNVTLDEQVVRIFFYLPDGVNVDKKRSFELDVTHTVDQEQSYIYMGSADGYYKDGTITIPDFAGSGSEVTYTRYEDGAVAVTYDGSELTYSRSYYRLNGQTLFGSYTFGDYHYTNLQISQIGYDYDNYESCYYFYLHGWGVKEDESKETVDIYLTVPDDYQSKEYEKNVVVYAVTDSIEATEGVKLHWDISISGSLVTINNPFEASSTLSFPYTMQTDGEVAASWNVGGYFSRTLTFEGFKYARLHEYARTYDDAKKLFKWEIGLEEVIGSGDIERYNVYIQLPDDFSASRPAVTEDLTAEVINDIKDRQFVIDTTATADIAYLDEGELTISTLLGKSISIPLSWNMNGTVNTNGTYSLSGRNSYFIVFEEYYQAIKIDASKSRYVKGEEDEYLDLDVTFTKGYEVEDLTDITLRIYIEKNSESAKHGDIIAVYVSAYDENGEESDYDTLPHYYTVEDGKLIVKDFLYSGNDLEVTYYSDNIVTTNLASGTTTGSYYAFATDFTSLTYEGDAEGAEWDSYQGSKYTMIDVTLGENEYSISFYQPNNVSYTTGVNDITINSNGVGEYYNLQGIRVNNPAHGIYIRRQGNQVSKVLVK